MHTQTHTHKHTNTLTHKPLSFADVLDICMYIFIYATSVRGLKLLVYDALSYLCMRP